MPKLTINGTELEVEKGTTVIEAAAHLGVDIPHFCYHPALSRPANCRMCLVEVEKFPKLQPACYTVCGDGMVVHTDNDKVKRARKAVLEFILINHPIDCPICDQAGECKLQNLYFEYSAQESRLNTRKVTKVKVFPLGPEVVYDGDRCILCTRCVRFCDQISKTSELTTSSRTDMTEIRTFPGRELDNDYSLCVVDLCPVGALTSRNFRFKCRVWYLSTTPSLCTGCARGCNVHLEHFKDEVQRYRPRANPEVNQWWMCDHGRATSRLAHEDRLLAPEVRGRGAVPRNEGLFEAVRHLRSFLDTQGVSKLALVLSPQLPSEDLLAYLDLAAKLGRPRLYVSGKPDNAFTLRRDPSRVADDFLIQADKNPNRAGLLRLAEATGFEVLGADKLADHLASGAVRGAIFAGSDLPHTGVDRETLLAALGRCEMFLHLGARQHPFTSLAHVSLPACTHAERDGSFVNGDGIYQTFSRAFDPHGLSLPDWQWVEKLCKRLQLGWSFAAFDELQRVTAERLAAPPRTTDSDSTAATA